MKAKILVSVTASIAGLGIVAVATRSNSLAMGYIVLSVSLLTAVSIGGVIEIRRTQKKTAHSIEELNSFGGNL